MRFDLSLFGDDAKNCRGLNYPLFTLTNHEIELLLQVVKTGRLPSRYLCISIDHFFTDQLAKKLRNPVHEYGHLSLAGASLKKKLTDSLELADIRVPLNLFGWLAVTNKQLILPSDVQFEKLLRVVWIERLLHHNGVRLIEPIKLDTTFSVVVKHK